MFTHEDLETFVVGLRCTKPGLTQVKTAIRMSHGQLVGEPDAPVFSPHPPVTGADALTMTRWRAEGHRSSGGDGVPGIDLDLAMLEGYLSEIEDFAVQHGTDTSAYGLYELSVQWGVLLAGRLARVEHYAAEGTLTGAQADRLNAFHARVDQDRDLLRDLNLPLPRRAKTFQAAS